MMKSGELRAMTNEDLLARIDELQKNLFNMRVQNVTKELTDTSKLPSARKDIARIKTILRERNILV